MQFEEVLEFIFELHPQGAFEFTVVEHEVGSTEDVFGVGPGRKGFEAQVAVEGPAGLAAAVVVDGPDPGFFGQVEFGFEGALLPVLDRGDQGPYQGFAEVLIHSWLLHESHGFRKRMGHLEGQGGFRHGLSREEVSPYRMVETISPGAGFD